MTVRHQGPRGRLRGAARREAGESYWSCRAPTILVPLDGSLEAKVALPVARLISNVTGAAIQVVYATHEALSTNELVGRLGLTREEVRGVVVEQLSGPPPAAVVRAAEERDARLIVMSTRGRTAYQGRTLRPVPEEVLRSATCPVVMVRPEIGEKVARTQTLQRILLPIDGAPSTVAVIGPALALAERSGAEVDVMYVAETRGIGPQEPGTIVAPRYVDQPQYEWPAWAREFLARICAVDKCLPTVPIRMFLRGGEPGAEILRFAAEHGSDLIVLEWRGKFDPEHASVVRRVLEGAPAPVLLLRTYSGFR